LDESNPYFITKEETKKTLDDAIRVKNEFGMRIGSLVSYPLCFLEDLEKYKDFVGRGCPSQSGHRMSINANGDLHVCVHEEENYGNILKSSIHEVYQNNMRKWHNGQMVYKGCEGCEYIDMCSSGCQMVSVGFNGETASKDPLYVGPNNVKKHYNLEDDVKIDEIKKNINSQGEFKVLNTLRFRQEDGFYLINIRWGNSITVNNEVAEFILKYYENGQKFTLNDFPNKDNFWFLNLYLKGIFVSDEINHNADVYMQGVSANVEHLPNLD